LIEEIESVFYLIILVVPFSGAKTEISGTGAAIQLPTEPLLWALILVWGLQLILNPRPLRQFAMPTRRITYALLLFLATAAFSVVTSTLPFMSFKRLLNTGWYIAACYFFVVRNCSSPRHVRNIMIAMFLAAGVVTVFALAKHSLSGFSNFAASESVRPFFTEHGSYAEHLSILFGIAAGLCFGTGRFPRLRLLAAAATPLFFLGILFSYTRAAWVGVACVGLFFFVIRAKEFLRFRSFVIVAVAAVAFSGVGVILGVQQSVERTATTIADPTHDLSTLGRIDRWISGLNMIRAHPLIGVGFATYPEHYEQYRDKRFITPVSNFYGGVHNDYLQYWAEQGIFGLLTWLFFLATLYSIGIKYYFRITDEFVRNALLGTLGGILTHVVHALFNDFLLYDKVAVPFWVAVAFVVVLVEYAWVHDHVRRT
jgi:O-antigen ligase